jgi:uncharacterized membrane protein
MSISPLLSASLAIQIHTLSAIAAAVLGAIVLFRRKGTPTHRLMGRIWCGLMLVTATSAIFIHETRLIGPFSPIHLFVIVTYVGLWEGLRQIRRGNVAAHQAAMKTLYVGALMLAGAFTLLPGRRINEALFGPEAGWAPALLAIAAVLVAAGLLWWRWRLFLPPRTRRVS